MTVREWLDARTPRPPRALSERLAGALVPLAAHSTDDVPETLLRASEAIIGDLLGRGGSGRDSALDLLAADALMTYALEAAAADIGTLEARASDAMCRVSAIADAASPSA